MKKFASIVLFVSLFFVSCDEDSRLSNDKQTSSDLTLSSSPTLTKYGLTIGQLGIWHNELVNSLQLTMDPNIVPDSCQLLDNTFYNEIEDEVKQYMRDNNILQDSDTTNVYSISIPQLQCNLTDDLYNEADTLISTSTNLSSLEKSKITDLLDFTKDYVLNDGSTLDIDSVITELQTFETDFNATTWGPNDTLAIVLLDIYKSSVIRVKDNFFSNTSSISNKRINNNKLQGIDQEEAAIYAADFLGAVVAGGTAAAAGGILWSWKAAFYGGSGASQATEFIINRVKAANSESEKEALRPKLD